MLKQPNALIFGREREQKAHDAIRALVTTIPGARVEKIVPSRVDEYDFEAVIQQGRSRHILLCDVKSRAWSNELHAIAHRLKLSVQSHPARDCTPVLIAPFFSPQAIDTCAELGLSWADLSGNCELRIEGAYVKIRGLHNPYRKGRGTASLYSPKSAKVVHALLLDPHRRWTTEELASRAGVSFGQVASVKKLLEANNWLRASYGETTLTEPRKLLDDWSQHYKPQRKAFRLFTLDTPARLEERIETTLSDYAFTEFSAAQRYAPHTRHQRVALYVPRWQEEQATAIGLKAGDGAANVTVYETGEELTLVESLSGSRCVSPVLTYLDLKLLAGRGQDAAEHLLKSVIEARWN